MNRTLRRRIAKLEAALEPPIRINFANVYETLGVSAERLISREERGNLVVETWGGPTQEQHALTTFGVAGKKAT